MRALYSGDEDREADPSLWTLSPPRSFFFTNAASQSRDPDRSVGDTRNSRHTVGNERRTKASVEVAGAVRGECVVRAARPASPPRNARTRELGSSHQQNRQRH